MLDVAVRNADAAQSPSELVSRAAARTLPLMELVQVGEGLQAQGQRAQAAELYKTWIAFNGDHEYVHIAYFNFSVALRTIDDTSGAINALRECLRINPRFEPARINLGCALEAGGSPHLAVAQW